MEGYYTGVLDIYYALITKPETATTKPVYAAPAVMGKTIEVTITPNYKEGSVYASNVATRNEKRVDSYTVSVNVDKLSYAVRKALLGRTQDSKGKFVRRECDDALAAVVDTADSSVADNVKTDWLQSVYEEAV